MVCRNKQIRRTKNTTAVGGYLRKIPADYAGTNVYSFLLVRKCRPPRLPRSLGERQGEWIRTPLRHDIEKRAEFMGPGRWALAGCGAAPRGTKKWVFALVFTNILPKKWEPTLRLLGEILDTNTLLLFFPTDADFQMMKQKTKTNQKFTIWKK